ncbi:RHS repeat-associated core domain-containing protein [Pseudomonas sp. MLB6B]
MNSNRIFCRNGRITTIKDDSQGRSIFEYSRAPLAEVLTGIENASHLLATDSAGSVTVAKDDVADEKHNYSPYGNACTLPSSNTLFGFNREWMDLHGLYSLGNYRFYSPALMRFCSPDSWSPFGKGGISTYAYCAGDPINRSDPTGHMSGRRFKKKGEMSNSKRMEFLEPVAQPMAQLVAQPVAESFDAGLGDFSRGKMTYPMEKIMEYLKPRDITALSLTSRSMNQFAQSTSESLAIKRIEKFRLIIHRRADPSLRLANSLPGVSMRVFNYVEARVIKPGYLYNTSPPKEPIRKLDAALLRAGYPVFSRP